MNPVPENLREKALEEASHWYVTLQGDEVSDADLQQWQRWMDASPGNAAAFDDIALLWQAAGALDEGAVLAARQAVASAAPASPPATRASGQHGRRRRRRGLVRWAAGIAALLVLAIGTVALLPQSPGSHDLRVLSTGIGERREIRLEDGSTLELDAASELSVRFDDRTRTVSLARGQAFFDVAHDSARPFLVESGTLRSRVLGTRFAVSRRQDDSVSVTVGEGVVQVEAPGTAAHGGARHDLGRDQRVDYSPARGLSAPRALNAGLATAWRGGTVVYQSEPLARVIEDLNRYSQRRVHLQDPSLAGVEVTGLWQSGDVDTWIAGLADSLRLEVVRTSDAIELQPRGTPP